MTTPTFDPPVGPSFELPLEVAWDADETEFVKPYVQVVPRNELAIRAFDLQWNLLTRAQRDYIQSFFHRHRGPATPFYWTPTDPVFAPEDDGPEVDQVAGGSLSERTYYVRFSWYDSTTGQETTPSPAKSITVQSSYLLSVTVPRFPSRVTAWRVYVGTVADYEYLQAYDIDRTWTEPSGGITEPTSLPPSVNTLKPAAKWRLLGTVRERKRSANRFSLSLRIGEVFL